MLSVSGFLPIKFPPSCVPHTFGGFSIGFKIKALDCVKKSMPLILLL